MKAGFIVKTRSKNKRNTQFLRYGYGLRHTEVQLDQVTKNRTFVANHTIMDPSQKFGALASKI